MRRPRDDDDEAAKPGDEREQPGDELSLLSPADQVIAWLVDGQRESMIREAIAQHFPNEDPIALLEKAVQHFATAAHCDWNVVKGWGLQAYQDLYRRMIEIGDFANALRAAKCLIDLAAKPSVHPQDESERDDEGDAVDGSAERGGGPAPRQLPGP